MRCARLSRSAPPIHTLKITVFGSSAAPEVEGVAGFSGDLWAVILWNRLSLSAPSRNVFGDHKSLIGIVVKLRNRGCTIGIMGRMAGRKLVTSLENIANFSNWVGLILTFSPC